MPFLLDIFIPQIGIVILELQCLHSMRAMIQGTAKTLKE